MSATDRMEGDAFVDLDLEALLHCHPLVSLLTVPMECPQSNLDAPT